MRKSIRKGLNERLTNRGCKLEIAKKHIDKKIENMGLIIARLARMTEQERNQILKNEIESIKIITIEVDQIKKTKGILTRKEIGDYITNKTIDVLRDEAKKMGKAERVKMSEVLEELERV